MSNHERTGPPSRGEGASESATLNTTRETALTHAWQQASDELPPRELDAAIIAAARKSVQDPDADSRAINASRKSRPNPNARHWWLQWQPLAAAASVAGLAFILVHLMPRDREVAPPTSVAITPADSDAQEMADEQAGASVPAIPEAEEKTEAADDDKAATAKTPGPPVTMEAPAAAVTSHAETATPSIKADQRGAVASEMAGPTAPAAAAASAPARERNAGNAAAPGAADRAANIAALYASGDVTGAAEALRAFRSVEPDADRYLPDSLRDWARTVR